jgi:hypothetical protein
VDGPSGRIGGKADTDANPGVSDTSPKRTDAAQRWAADRVQVLHEPAQGQRWTPSTKARDTRVSPRRARYTLVASGLTNGDLAKLTARGFRIEARTKGGLIPRTIQLQPPYGLSLDQARRAVRKINSKAVVDFNTYYYTDRETPAGLATETPGQ